VAAMSDGGDRVFGASDRMLTGRDVEFEPSQTKIFGLTRSIAILVAGDTAMQIEVLHKVRADVKARVQAEPDNWWNVSDVADLYSRYYNEARSKRSENAILAPLGLNRTSYLDRQQQLSSDLVIQIADRLTKYESPRVQAIVMGVDTTGGHIYVCDNGTITCQDAVGFASIGIGYWHANSQFMFGGHTKYKAMPETLLMTYFAKKRAEVAPGVGAQTDMLMIGPELGSYITIGEEPLQTLEQIWQKAQTKRKELEKEAQEEINKYLQSLIDASTAQESPSVPEVGQDAQAVNPAEPAPAEPASVEPAQNEAPEPDEALPESGA